MISAGGTSGSKNEKQAGPVEKRKRQAESEDTRDGDWLPGIGAKSKKRALQIPPRAASAIKVGPPRGAKRKDQPKQTATDAPSPACPRKSPEAIPKAASLAVQSSCAKPSPMGPIRLYQEEEESSEDDLNPSQEALSISVSDSFRDVTAHNLGLYPLPFPDDKHLKAKFSPRTKLSTLESHGREHPIIVKGPSSGARLSRYSAAPLMATWLHRFTCN